MPSDTVGAVYMSDTRRFRYHNDPDRTSSVRRDGYVTAGDFGWLDDEGYLYLADRRSDLIISVGVNIYPAEIEATLMEHEAVVDTAVIGVPDPEWGQNVKAFVELAPAIVATDDVAEELISHVGTRLAAFKKPRSIEFREHLPRTETGKLLRREPRDDLGVRTDCDHHVP